MEDWREAGQKIPGWRFAYPGYAEEEPPIARLGAKREKVRRDIGFASLRAVVLSRQDKFLDREYKFVFEK